MKKIIMAENLVKSFGVGSEKTTVLDEVSVEINEGEFVAVMGPSGSGKTTLIFALSGMDNFESGKVTFEDQNISTLSEKEMADLRRNRMGFVFQQPTMLKNLNILDNIVLPSMRDNRKKASKVSDKAKTLMEKVGIGELDKRDITQVSGGQLQRAGICRALINSPSIVFGDEPTGALNSKTSQEIMEIFSELNREGITIMFVTHDAMVAAQSERVLFMIDGKLVSEVHLPKFDGSELEVRIEKIRAEMLKAGI
ncbi:MAG: ABC transporter ATP-binding protein [Alkalibacterium sp.]|uniref:ABC transporter ATP-binding protein n=1 Tax=Alkalibacterium sp. TaxID=1872447 RepID=UPI00397065F2